MPYSDPAKAKEASLRSSRRYAERHPERIKNAGRKWYEGNAEYARLKAAAHRAKKKGLPPPAGFVPRGRNVARNDYGLTSAAYRDLVESQGGRCALCEMVAPLCVDHEHVDGWSKLPPRERAKHVRGLLCAPCNLFIGHCREDVTVMVQKSQRIALGVEAYLRRKP